MKRNAEIGLFTKPSDMRVAWRAGRPGIHAREECDSWICGNWCTCRSGFRVGFESRVLLQTKRHGGSMVRWCARYRPEWQERELLAI